MNRVNIYLQPRVHVGASSRGISVDVLLVFSHVINVGVGEDRRTQNSVVFILLHDMVSLLLPKKDIARKLIYLVSKILRNELSQNLKLSRLISLVFFIL